MAFASYTELKGAIANWLTSEELLGREADFIALAEADLEAQLRVRQMVQTATLTPTGGAVDLPADFLEMVSVSRPVDGVTLDYMPFDTAARRRLTVAGTPTGYAISGSRLVVAPSADNAVAIRYYARLPRLASDAETNWFLSLGYHALLYGALAQSAPFLREDARVQMWAAMYQRAVDGLNASHGNAYHGGTAKRRASVVATGG